MMSECSGAAGDNDFVQQQTEEPTAEEESSPPCKNLDDDECTSSMLLTGESYKSETCSSCSTRRESFDESDFEITFNSLFCTPSSSTTSHSSNINSPNNNGGQSLNILEGIDSLLHRITSERFAELRSIQLSERPVTNGIARGNIETFLRRAVHGLTEEERHLEEDAHRPTQVINDVQLLQQRSLVRSSLQNDFRDILERTLSSRFQSPQTSSHNVPQRQESHLVGGTNFRARLESLFGGQSTGSGNHTRVARTPVSSASQQQHRPPHPSTQQRVPQPPPDAIFNEDSTPSNYGITIDAGLQLLVQNITDDLNRLESLQVVSGMLRGDFRNNLESMVQQHITNETTANNTQQFIRSLPGRRPTPHSVHRQSVHPQSQSQAAINSGVTEELGSLRGQMEEMKRMLAMSMEIQMDTQRAVRQEVAAIFSTFMQDYLVPRAAAAPSTQPTILYPPTTTPVSSGQCVICVDRSVDTVFYQCGHMCTCNQCGLQLKMDGRNCPMCRAPIRDVIRAYQTQ